MQVRFFELLTTGALELDDDDEDDESDSESLDPDSLSEDPGESGPSVVCDESGQERFILQMHSVFCKTRNTYLRWTNKTSWQQSFWRLA